MEAVWQDYEVRVNDEFVLRGNAALLKCLVPSYVSDVVQIESWTSNQGEVFGGSDWGKQNHHIILHSPFLCFGYSCEPVVPGPCARWVRVARQRWASPMFDPVVRQRFCHRRHLGGRWWDSHYGRQPRYWFTSHQPYTTHTHVYKNQISMPESWRRSLDPSGNAGMEGKWIHPLPLMNHIFFFLIYFRSANERGIFTNEFLTIFELFLWFIQVDNYWVTNQFLSPPPLQNSFFLNFTLSVNRWIMEQWFYKTSKNKTKHFSFAITSQNIPKSTVADLLSRIETNSVHFFLCLGFSLSKFNRWSNPHFFFFFSCFICLAKTKCENKDGKYMVLPSGELHIRDVSPEDGYKSYRCRTKHRLTGETRLSATAGRLVVTGELPERPTQVLIHFFFSTSWQSWHMTQFPKLVHLLLVNILSFL